MDIKNMLNNESVEPTVRRFSSSHDGGSVRNDSVSRTDSVSLPSRKRSRSPSQSQPVQAEPSPKRLKPKKRGPKEVPIWARKWTAQWQDQNGRKNGYIANHEPSASPNATPTAGPPPPGPPPPRQAPAAQPPQRLPARPSTAGSHHETGKREPTYENEVPADELTRSVIDFIYSQVIANGLIFKPPPNTEIEIEAKIGSLEDRGNNMRYRLPVLHEAALEYNDQPIFSFKSSMTERQHQQMNNQLNIAVQQSRLVTAERNKMNYVHLHERDTFYEAPNQILRELPQNVRDKIHKMRSKPRVRLTRNTKTGDLKAAIIKIRWADMHVYSPRTMFDWRISISLEMAYPGDVSTLEPALDAGRAVDGRDKDRLSYEHQGIKIDLTQVVMDQSKVHELEFELPTDALRREAELMRQNQPNEFFDVVKNFVDDVRIATRKFPRE